MQHVGHGMWSRFTPFGEFMIVPIHYNTKIVLVLGLCFWINDSGCLSGLVFLDCFVSYLYRLYIFISYSKYNETPKNNSKKNPLNYTLQFRIPWNWLEFSSLFHCGDDSSSCTLHGRIIATQSIP